MRLQHGRTVTEKFAAAAASASIAAAAISFSPSSSSSSSAAAEAATLVVVAHIFTRGALGWALEEKTADQCRPGARQAGGNG